MNPMVDDFIANEVTWGKEFALLREIILSCNLNEELKWGVPCYTNNKSNIVLIHGFKKYCAILFINGSLITDEDNVLVQQTDNVQASRQIRFTNIDQINQLRAIIIKYIKKAIELESKGIKVEFKKTSEYKIPEELDKKLKSNKEFNTAFYALTPGRQRAYILYFSQAKQQQTREQRIDKCMPLILQGKGLKE